MPIYTSTVGVSFTIRTFNTNSIIANNWLAYAIYTGATLPAISICYASNISARISCANTIYTQTIRVANAINILGTKRAIAVNWFAVAIYAGAAYAAIRISCANNISARIRYTYIVNTNTVWIINAIGILYTSSWQTTITNTYTC